MRALVRLLSLLLLGIVMLGAAPASRPVTFAERVVQRARQEVERKVSYSAAYVSLPYPAGDLPQRMGACTDLLIRAYRNAGIDLQKEVHEDHSANPDLYPDAPDDEKKIDPNLDHRRCRNLVVWFRRHAQEMPRGFDAAALKTYEPGDVVFINFFEDKPGYPDHVAVVAESRDGDGMPFIYDNMGPFATKRRLDHFRVVNSHFRWKSTEPGAVIQPNFPVPEIKVSKMGM